jgi:hypothetical protein
VNHKVAELDNGVISLGSGDLIAVADGRKRASGLFKFPWNGPIAKEGVIYQIDEGGAAAYALKLDVTGKQAPLWTAKVPGGRYYATSLHAGADPGRAHAGAGEIDLTKHCRTDGWLAILPPLINQWGAGYDERKELGIAVYAGADRVDRTAVSNTIPPL